jgi:hypothetical protein
MMKRSTACLLCLLALLTLAVPEALSQDVQNSSQGKQVLMLGEMNTRSANDLGASGARTAAPVGSMSLPALSGQRSPFDLGQRLGKVGNFSFNSTFRPTYNVSAYSRIKPIYDIPDFLKPKSLYDIEAYSRIKAPNAIP